jgi:hypothetical protein
MYGKREEPIPVMGATLLLISFCGRMARLLSVTLPLQTRLKEAYGLHALSCRSPRFEKRVILTNRTQPCSISVHVQCYVAPGLNRTSLQYAGEPRNIHFPAVSTNRGDVPPPAEGHDICVSA